MRFDVITIFPRAFDSYFNESIIKRAKQKKLVDIRVHNLRDYTKDKHRKVDDKPYGGGPGMVLQVEPIMHAVDKLLSYKFTEGKGRKLTNLQTYKLKTKIILTSARGKQFTQTLARQWAKKYKQLIIVCGHYEGIDERFKSIIRSSKFAIQEVSIGPYILTGGELPAMIMVDAVIRHIPGVLGKQESLEEIKGSYSVFTRPEVFVWPPPGRGKKWRKYTVPRVLLSGSHKKIEEWRKKHSK